MCIKPWYIHSVPLYKFKTLNSHHFQTFPDFEGNTFQLTWMNEDLCWDCVSIQVLLHSMRPWGPAGLMGGIDTYSWFGEQTQVVMMSEQRWQGKTAVAAGGSMKQEQKKEETWRNELAIWQFKWDSRKRLEHCLFFQITSDVRHRCRMNLEFRFSLFLPVKRRETCNDIKLFLNTTAAIQCCSSLCGRKWADVFPQLLITQTRRMHFYGFQYERWGSEK